MARPVVLARARRAEKLMIGVLIAVFFGAGIILAGLADGARPQPWLYGVLTSAALIWSLAVAGHVHGRRVLLEQLATLRLQFDRQDQWKWIPVTRPWCPPSFSDVAMDSTGHLAVLMRGSEDSFTGILINLMRKADPLNRRLLAMVFPGEDLALRLWEKLSPTTMGELTMSWNNVARAEGLRWE